MINYYANTILARQLQFACSHGERAKRARIAKQSEWDPHKRFPGVGERQRAGDDSSLVKIKFNYLASLIN